MAAIAVVPKKTSEFGPGQHPNSQDNLMHEGRPLMYGESKKRRQILATDEGWEGFKALAKTLDISASELVERLGRGAIKLAK